MFEQVKLLLYSQKTPVLESLFNKVAGQRDSNTGVSL